MKTFAEFLRLKMEAITYGAPTLPTKITPQQALALPDQQILTMLPPDLQNNQQFSAEIIQTVKKLLSQGLVPNLQNAVKLAIQQAKNNAQFQHQQQPQDKWSTYDSSAKGMPSAKGY